jgi:hypothetical protein
MPVLFAAAIFLSAALLFWVELMVAKMVLPKFGGGPAVWNTCVLFFQAVLLLGYAYAHIAPARLGVRRQALAHVGLILLPLLVLPLVIPDAWVPPANLNPVVCLLGYLAAAAGLPFFVVCTTAPLLQKWFAGTGHPRAKDPYFLYAASNLGSFVGLLGYPAVIEPALGLGQQGWLWAGGYALLVVLIAACAFVAWRSNPAPEPARPPAKPVPPAAPPTALTRCYWVALAFVPSSLMLGATTYFTSEVAPVPMLWVVPLGLYLLTFIIAFGRLPVPLHRVLTFAVPALVLWVAWVMTAEDVETVKVYGAMKRLIPLHLATLFVVGLVLHGRLARERPGVQHLTEYFFWISLGGVLGGVFNGVVAPLVFSATWEYPLTLVLAALLAPPWRELAQWRRARRLDFALSVPLAVLAAGLFAYKAVAPPPGGMRVLHRERNFFGVITILTDDKGYYNRFYHGKTNHGAQNRGDPRLRRLPLLYFYYNGPVGQTFAAFRGKNAKEHVAVVGLGAGTLATYGEPGQEFTFFEIDPAVERAARSYFTYLDDSPAACRFVFGDGRLSMAREPDGYYGMIVLDAFSSDSLPVHLITEEAMSVYLKKLAPDGIIVVNISNNYLDLESVVAGVARDCELQGIVQLDDHISEHDQRLGKCESHWVVLARDRGHFGKLAEDPRWRVLRGRKPIRGWSDDYSNLFGVLNWN